MELAARKVKDNAFDSASFTHNYEARELFFFKCSKLALQTLQSIIERPSLRMIAVKMFLMCSTLATELKW